MKKLFTILFLIGLTATLSANDITVSNMGMSSKNTTEHFALVQFDISWSNSWRTSAAPFNWDAVWVFVKYRANGGAWQHAWLNDAGHTTPTGTIIDIGLLKPDTGFNATTNPGLGAFIYRSADGTGTNTFTGVKLRWNYGANGASDADVFEIKVFAIEMVYVPGGGYYLGSGGGEQSAFYKYPSISSPYQVTDEGAITVGNSANNLYYSTGVFTGDASGPIPATFPKGYLPFYCMKYEMSQQGYVDFLNSLTITQASARYPNKTTNRHGITVSGDIYSTTLPYVACNFLSWPDVAAYLDWSGLRPMTELEFEKGCRGTGTPTANAYAWGSITVTQNTGITNPGLINETSSNSGNCTYGNLSGMQAPMRVGAFATSTSTTRQAAGSAYYGMMEMSGNLWERVITVGNSTGRTFIGSHGNGILLADGTADVSTWPGLTGSGAGYRTGTYFSVASLLRVSDRSVAAYTDVSRTADYGGRGVRTASATLICGTSTLVIDHVTSDGVAPVNKTVAYGTVTGIPGEVSKCWITKNLGATDQASSVSDNTETSAGWYWQFNRKQGYKHSGPNAATTVIPSWTINSIDESSDWQSGNDPCSIELGSAWRIPAASEYVNIDNAGSWTNWTGPYGSNLKMHGAGYIDKTTGALTERGIHGYYWSSTQNISTEGWLLDFSSGFCDKWNHNKAHGFSLRCVRSYLPVLTTTTVSSIGISSGSSGGNVTEDGGSTITARGVCWSTSSGPTIALGTKTTDGSGTGTFTSLVSPLFSGTLYYVRAYATNFAGTSYGNEVSFTTSPGCFIAGTKISMADGSFKNIEEIKVGDQVKSVKTETMEVITTTVTRTIANPPSNNLIKVTFSNGETTTSTREHPYWVAGKGWSCEDPTAFKETPGIMAKQLNSGDKCMVVQDGKLFPATILRIENQPQLTEPTFTFDVAEASNYFANHALVNSKAP